MFCFLTACSFSALYFKDSYYLFGIILPVLLFIIFIRYQPESYFTRIVYCVLPLGGILFWVVTSLKGASLFVLLVNNSSYDGFIISPWEILLAFVLPGCFLSAALTSLFAFGIFRREYPAWWKYLSCWNSLIILATCFSAFLVFMTPLEQSIGVGFGYPIYKWVDRDTSNSPLVIEKSYYFKGSSPSPKNKLPTRTGFSEQHFILNQDKGKVTFFGREKFMWRNLLSVSSDNRWVVYSCPTLKWGVYYTLGLWAENLDTSEQYLLMTMDSIDVKTGELLDGGKRFLLINHQRKTGKQSLVLFSIAKGKPRILNEIQISNSFNLIHIDKMDRLYFHDWNSKLVSCYNSDLVKIYDVTAIQEKVDELKSELDHKKQGNVHASRVPIISPGGEFMIFSIRGSFQNQDTENKKQSRKVRNQVWYTDLANSVSKKINDVKFENYYYRWKPIHWHPFSDNLVVDTHISKPGHQELRLLDLESGTTKTLLIKKSDDGPEISNFEWSGNGKYFLTYCTTTKPSRTTVNLYAFDSKTRTCSIVSSKTNLKNWGSHLWSTERSHVVFSSEKDNGMWCLNLITGKWLKIVCPFNNYRLLGISNHGDIYVSPRDKIQIYRLTENQSEIIFQGK